MAGGIFTDKPFELNMKCVIISMVLCLAYWFLPHRNVYLIPVIFVLSYIAIAVYDHLYDCNTSLKTGKYGPQGIVDSIFKPQYVSDPLPGALDAAHQKSRYLRNVYLFHVFVVAPLLLYIGVNGVRSNPQLFPVLFILGSLALIYHSIRLFKPRE